LRYDATINGQAADSRLFRMGGFFDLSGLNRNQLSGQHAARLGLSLQTEFSFRHSVVECFVWIQLPKHRSVETPQMVRRIGVRELQRAGKIGYGG